MHTGQACTHIHTYKQMRKHKHACMQTSLCSYICLTSQCSTDGVVFLVVVANWKCMHTNLIIIYEQLGKNFFMALRKDIPNMIMHILNSL